MFRRARNWYAGLSRAAKVLLGAFGAFFVIAAIGGAGGNQQRANLTASHSQPNQQQTTPAPKVSTRTFTEDETIPFEKTTVDDPNMDQGRTEITTQGVEGTRTNTYEVTTTDGVDGPKVLKSSSVTKQPVAEVTSTGTKVPAPSPQPTRQASGCDPNYSGACVPIASDVDCAGGSGNGPAYVRGPVYVVGIDIYGLDRDGDGVGCQ